MPVGFSGAHEKVRHFHCPSPATSPLLTSTSEKMSAFDPSMVKSVLAASHASAAERKSFGSEWDKKVSSVAHLHRAVMLTGAGPCPVIRLMPYPPDGRKRASTNSSGNSSNGSRPSAVTWTLSTGTRAFVRTQPSSHRQNCRAKSLSWALASSRRLRHCFQSGTTYRQKPSLNATT